MRYHPLSEADRNAMLATIGVSSIEALYADAPPATLLKTPLDLPTGKSELDVERFFARLAARNMPASRAPFFVGAGAYKHHIPASVDHLIQRSEFLTSYTPYQPEISQGTLQYLFEFQTQVALLTGMEVANASMYDGSTATAEAVLMAHRVTKRRKALLSGGLHPHYAEVVRTISRLAEDEVETMAPDIRAAEDLIARIDDTLSCVVVQTPDVFGNLRDLTKIAEAATRTARFLSPSSPKPCRLVSSNRLARWAPTSSSAKASRSAIRSISADLMSVSSRRGMNSCGRCPAASPAKASTPTASAAMC